MDCIILRILTITLLWMFNPVFAQEIWRENFSVPEKGVWGSNDATYINTDFEGITTWTLDYSNIYLSDSNDYAKTVSTSGGRFEVRDIDGEVIWISSKIDISGFETVKIQLHARETGSGANEETKYLKAFYKVDEYPEKLFESSGENRGNWGDTTLIQRGVSGASLQIIVRMANFYSADKVILDEIVVSAEINYESVEPGDVVLNEILFNPYPGGSDYVEIYNKSDKIISLKNLFLASRDNNQELTQIYLLSESDFPLQSSSYLALTKDTNGVFPFYFIECATCFRQMEKFPSFNNDEDDVVLLNEKMEIIDEFHYDENMHGPNFYEVEGISLERLSFSMQTSTSGNWYSASTVAGYGTPGYTNSQKENSEISKPELTFEPEAFSPNLDGFNDEYQIHYNMDKPGYLANIMIFDAVGRFVLHLAKNDVLGSTGTFTWNGEDETGQRQGLGVYVVLVEFFNAEGEVFRYKDGVVLTDVLE